MSLSYHSFSIDRLPLFDVLRSAQSLFDKKTSNDIISINIQPNSELHLVLSDGSMFMEAQLDIYDLQLADNLSTKYSLSLGLIYDLVRKLDVKLINFKVYDKKVSLEYEDGDFQFTIINHEIAPIQIDSVGANFSINSTLITETLKALKTTMPTEDIRDQFKGISVILNDHLMTLWSTDGIKMAISEVEVNSKAKIDGIWPRKFVDILCTINSDKIAYFEMYPRHIKCKIDNLLIISPLVNASPLNYKAILNHDSVPTVQINIDSQYLLKKLDRILILSDTGILFTFNQASTISCWSKQQSDHGIEKLDMINWTDKEVKFYANGAILISFLRSFKGNILFSFYEDNKNIIVQKNYNTFPLYLTKAMTFRNE